MAPFFSLLSFIFLQKLPSSNFYCNEKLMTQKVHQLIVYEPWFTFIEQKRKKVESRLNGKYDIKEGDGILFQCETRTVQRVVKAVRYYDTFEKMLVAEDLESVLPGVTSIQDGVKIYHQFYTPEMEKKRGVAAYCIE